LVFRAVASASSRLTSVLNDSAIGPSFTAIVAFQVVSSTCSSSVAPGMQGTTRGTSISRAHTCSGGAATSNEFSSFTSDACRLELAQAAGAAEVVGRPLVLERVLGARDRDRHAADRVDCRLDELGWRRAAGVTPGDELGEDRDGDLFLRGGTEVEPGWAPHARECFLVHPTLPQLS